MRTCGVILVILIIKKDKTSCSVPNLCINIWKLWRRFSSHVRTVGGFQGVKWVKYTHGSYIWWYLRNRCSRNEQSLLFDVFKAKAKWPIFFHACASLAELPYNISTMWYSSTIYREYIYVKRPENNLGLVQSFILYQIVLQSCSWTQENASLIRDILFGYTVCTRILV